MDEITPPKRVTRARAAAKMADSEPKPTKIATAASKAKLTRSTSTTKRKTRSDEAPEVEEQQSTETIAAPEPVKTARGRSKKAAVQQPEPDMEEATAPVKSTRGRPKKTIEEPAASIATRTTRGRAKKVEDVLEEGIMVEEPPKRAPRTRAGTVSKATAPKKTVKFEEPDKENLVPPPPNPKTKTTAAEAGAGLRAKPVRKIASTTTRATRGRAKAVEEEPKKPHPLSPKKATQVAKGGEPSDDELATNEKTPMKPLMKSPIKPPTSVIGVAKKLDFSNSITCSRAIVHDMGVSIISSPARRPPQSPFKDSFKASSQKVTLGSVAGSPFKLSHPITKTATSDNSFKASLLQSLARRPQSPTKVTETGSPSRSNNSQLIFGQTPKANAFKISRFATPRTVFKTASRPGQMLPPSAPPKMSAGALQTLETCTNMALEPTLKFSGRLSSIMPREADPALQSPIKATGDTQLQMIDEIEVSEDPMVLDDAETVVVQDPKDSTSPTCTPPRNSTGAFELRQEHEDPFHESDSEDELAGGCAQYSSTFNTAGHGFETSPATPTPFRALATPPKQHFTPQLFQNAPIPMEKIGFTPLATQLSNWMAASPDKAECVATEQSMLADTVHDSHTEEKQTETFRPSPAKSTYFEDAMSVHDEMLAATAADEIDIGLAELDEEDFALAREADEMSLLEPEVAEDVQDLDTMFEIPEVALSEASQEYGDENAMPIDPALFAMPAVPDAPETPVFTTPKRVFTERVLHTTSKVPLKPAAEDSTPIRPSPKKRSVSISRLPIQRPTNTLKRNNTVISYSPTKSNLRNELHLNEALPTQTPIITTPSKPPTDTWSTLGTPARTPRRDLNPSLLRGAIVFVDVHTTEGADASVLFTELLTQMGARCVKSWNWNGNEEGSKIGITHVVFKDGGRRTLERVREARGVVACVGVGWVLDCERQNAWLPESSYAIDTSLIPRGGHRRRKSMEPRALANLNGMLVLSSNANTPARHTSYSGSPSRVFLHVADTPLTNKSRRRDSMIWERSPGSIDDDDNVDVNGKCEESDRTLILSPVPATPAPETISAYAEAYLDELNMRNEEHITPGGQTPYFLHTERLVQMTAPVNKTAEEKNLGGGFLPSAKDEGVMARLMAARRKSLQWAPRVGSPLKREGF